MKKFYKGQLILKCLFGIYNCPKKTNEKIQLYYYGISSQIVFICFLGELKTSKGHFEINLPLLCKSVLQKCAYMFVSTSIFWLNYYLKHFWKAVLNKDML